MHKKTNTLKARFSGTTFPTVGKYVFFKKTSQLNIRIKKIKNENMMVMVMVMVMGMVMVMVMVMVPFAFPMRPSKNSVQM